MKFCTSLSSVTEGVGVDNLNTEVSEEDEEVEEDGWEEFEEEDQEGHPVVPGNDHPQPPTW
jgi:hypothetical protein